MSMQSSCTIVCMAFTSLTFPLQTHQAAVGAAGPPPHAPSAAESPSAVTRTSLYI